MFNPLSITPVVIPLLERDTPLYRENPDYFDPDPSLFLDPTQLPPPTRPGLSCILDLDETLVDARQGLIWVRPYVDDLLRWLRHKEMEVIVWSAGESGHVARCRQVLDPHRIYFDHVICRSPAWISGRGPAVKDLDLLPHRAGRCLLIDNNPFSGWNNPKCSVIVPDFHHSHVQACNDTTLLYVLQIAIRLHHRLLLELHCAVIDESGELHSERSPTTVSHGVSPTKGDLLTSPETPLAPQTEQLTTIPMPPSPLEHPLNGVMGVESPGFVNHLLSMSLPVGIERILASHPFLTWKRAVCRYGFLDYLRLDVADSDALAARVHRFQDSDTRRLETVLVDEVTRRLHFRRLRIESRSTLSSDRSGGSSPTPSHKSQIMGRSIDSTQVGTPPGTSREDAVQLFAQSHPEMMTRLRESDLSRRPVG